MAGKLVTVMGITGNQGSSVANAFLEGGWKVRGITRDPTRGSAKVWTDKGVEMVKADLDDTESLKAAFKGANAVFANSDFWVNMFSPETQAKAQEGGRSANELAYEAEVQQIKNVADAAAAHTDALDVLVVSTLSSSKGWSKGKYKHTYHFDAKADGLQYLYKTYPALAKKTSAIQMPLYINNWKTTQIMMPVKQPDGSYLMQLPMSGEKKMPMGDASRIAGPFVKALTEVDPGKTLVGSAGMLDWREWCEHVSKTLGVTCKYEEVPRGPWEEAVPGGLGEELADMFGYFNDFGYDGGDPHVIYPDQLGVPVKYQTAEQYFKDEDWSQMLQQ